MNPPKRPIPRRPEFTVMESFITPTSSQTLNGLALLEEMARAEALLELAELRRRVQKNKPAVHYSCTKCRHAHSQGSKVVREMSGPTRLWTEPIPVQITGVSNSKEDI